MSDNKITLTGRCMYPHLFQPKKWDNKPEPQFEIAIVIPQNEPVITELWNHAAGMLQAAFPGLAPSMENMPLSVDANNPHIQGCYVVKSWTRQAPQVYRTNASGGFDAVIDPNLIRDGDHVAVEVGLYTYDNMRKGVGAGLNSVLYLGPGQGALGRGGGSPPEQAFANVQMPATTTGPVTGVPPAAAGPGSSVGGPTAPQPSAAPNPFGQPQQTAQQPQPAAGQPYPQPGQQPYQG